MKRIQIILGIIGILILSILFSNCRGSKTEDSNDSFIKKPPFTVLEVSSQKWIAGIKDGGSGEILLVIFSNLKKEVTIKNAYYKNMETNILKDPNNPFIYVIYFNSKENKDLIMDSNIEKESANIPPRNFPFQLENNEVVISYLLKEKMYYYKYSNIIEKEVIAYPQTKPKSDN